MQIGQQRVLSREDNLKSNDVVKDISAGVPKEYVEMLTDGEAATESSRENTEELGEEEG